MHRGIATFTLDYGKCPPWLFERMVKLGREMTRVLIEEYGPDEFIKRISDPVWFQSLGTVLAFDWNASGLTTILTAALKEAIRGQEKDFGIFIAGGKGKTSRKTPDEIVSWGEKLSLSPAHTNNLVYNSRMSAKVDSSLVQDGFQIYHHSFFFSKSGAWTVVQQGMNTKNATARRYHWYSENIDDLIVEPHSGIATQIPQTSALNLTSRNSDKTRQISTQLISDGYQTLLSDIEIIKKHSTKTSWMATLKRGADELTLLKLHDIDFAHHPVEGEAFWNSPYLKKILAKLAHLKPETYEKLLSTAGVGPKTIRALSLVSEIIYGARPSYEDPARYSFAHGGKDSIPYPVDRPTYDQTIEILRQAVVKSRINPLEKDKAIGRLNSR
ncbi:hypothetical protein A3B45_01605 [Candidatus Daviesbacteria bacterium RIFCSPLOWO2_01_FULL_39_12]|uniref:DUF763 domain-containing protein n=1 Tax=Candidatus Daviesbacteria bacterium RIFCSPLOWO2_01_FULL_39_12 TaxID=1797785 RepID=A0A1F5KNJ1_9BACT|nr:MAG: hypothetical protein A3D79_02770 [Candidatus Daviesbacteria bacterium RIFCSPHIGHO2_02_FULL_39_8]OGE42486.1 MAG: hypothetical protein A3B45_01605 [Candidatus Daviesbacteria bacterium RIFCSPLOWO2_01_FULL_39_12]